MIKYFKYWNILRRLRSMKRKEYQVRIACSEMNIWYDDLNIRNINKAINRIKETWTRNNMID